jgi:hypothetical protein
MTKEQIETFKKLHKLFHEMAEEISKKFSEFFKINFDFNRIRLGDNYITITYYQYSHDYYDGEDEIDYFSVEYNELLFGQEKVLEKLIKERQQEIELEKEQEKQKEIEKHQKEFQNELELYEKLKKKFSPIYDD